MEENEIKVEHTENVQQQDRGVINVSEEIIVEKEPLKSSSDLSSMTREALVAYFTKIQESYKLSEIAKHLDEVKSIFDEQTKVALEDLRQKYIADGGEERDFKPVPDPLDQKMKDAYNKFRDIRKTEIEALEKEKQHNSLVKRNIIDNMTTILEKADSTEQYKVFKDLMAQWNSVGPVPSTEAAEINSKYKVCKDKFYDKMRINRELRELDMKRNYEEKIQLCEQAEKLVDVQSATKAFYQIQQIHAQWKQIGAVPAESRDALWERLKAATNVINERFHKFVDESKEKEKANYEAKLALIKEVEEIAASPMSTMKECDEAMKKVMDIQTRWRTIGFAPKEFNNSVYANFRKQCDVVFDKKRKFFKEFNSSLSANYEAKIKLCEKAEELSTSTDWKKTSDALIKLQKDWKKIGPVQHKHSDTVWNRFRAACDAFFSNKAQYIDGVESDYKDNLEKKKAIIEELKVFQMPEDSDEQFKILQSFQHRWNEIGYVPMKNKNEVNQEFSTLLNQLYDKMNVDDSNRNLQRFKARMELMASEQGGHDKVDHERTKLINKLKQVEQDITLLENNVGFFAESKQSAKLIVDINDKIKTAKKNVEVINAKLDIIDAILG